MADATTVTRLEERVVTEKVEVKEIVLKLTEEEAQTLYDMTYVTGGDPVQSRREHANNIMVALERTGTVELRSVSPYRASDLKGHLMFNNRSV